MSGRIIISGARYLLSKDKKLAQAIKNIFGFYPGNIFLYKQAIRHKSVAQEKRKGIAESNERLEYLGDAVLDLVVADYLFQKFPMEDEGFLTNMRSKIVSRSQLNKLSRKMAVDKLILAGKDVRSFSRSVGGDAFEAFIGAIYLDKGYKFTNKVIINRIIKCHIDIDSLEKTDLNFKSRLIEWGQKERKIVEFRIVETQEFNKKSIFFVQAIIDEIAYDKGQGHSIKEAEQNAAEKACNSLNC